MKKSIYVTSQDKQRLQDLLAVTAASGPRQQGDWKELAEELRRAVIVEPNEVPADVITMNSRADLVDLDTGETVTFTLVFPQDASWRKRRFPCSRRSARECSVIASATNSNGTCRRVFGG